MKKLNHLNAVLLCCNLGALAAGLTGLLTHILVLEVIAIAGIIATLVLHMILFRCPYCRRSIETRYKEIVMKKKGERACPFCGHSLEDE